jgi:hypothetical protein
MHRKIAIEREEWGQQQAFGVSERRLQSSSGRQAEGLVDGK